jgi:hypothetical protein
MCIPVAVQYMVTKQQPTVPVHLKQTTKHFVPAHTHKDHRRHGDYTEPTSTSSKSAFFSFIKLYGMGENYVQKVTFSDPLETLKILTVLNVFALPFIN